MSGAGYGNHGDDAEPKVPTERPDAEAASRPPKGGEDRPGFDLGGAGEGTQPGGGGLPSAGPHAASSLTNPDATPGAGTLPDIEGGNADPGAG